MSDTLEEVQITLPMDEIAAFCRRWNIAEFALFGSVLRENFGPESDIDVLVTFGPDHPRSLRDLIQMSTEIEGILGRSVDLVERQSIEDSPNYIRRKAILGSARMIYVA